MAQFFDIICNKKYLARRSASLKPVFLSDNHEASTEEYSFGIAQKNLSRRTLIESTTILGVIGVAGAGISLFPVIRPLANENRKLILNDFELRIKRVVVEHLDIDEDKVTSEATLVDDLGADSLDAVELVMAFENEFKIEIGDDACEENITVLDWAQYISKQPNLPTK